MPIQHASDCAVHNMPAYPNGSCDCGALPPFTDGQLVRVRGAHHLGVHEVNECEWFERSKTPYWLCRTTQVADPIDWAEIPEGATGIVVSCRWQGPAKDLEPHRSNDNCETCLLPFPPVAKCIYDAAVYCACPSSEGETAPLQGIADSPSPSAPSDANAPTRVAGNTNGE